MTPKPPKPPPPPPAVPPDFLVISEDSAEKFQERVHQAIASGMMAEPNTMQLSTVGGTVIFSQAFVRDPTFDLRRRTDTRTRNVIAIGGQ